eukprot:CAMPEP_0170539178 /NCGR_PEP_ID=MMETSP0209-20121228/103761_1 /TAXON_ID=665100 ORGANISM="Litonotus pictus, Strain P1" /NCGR_SAMPLE_ID=MMETSP0209 /ASSEMBLY_ACC=CAM_ASM_000301 /LENGTH=687 /DNA_ID=CAMNT_0010841031 /DNA_START=67 /DNA_END=2127 /DNA_ORIENTATION=-
MNTNSNVNPNPNQNNNNAPISNANANTNTNQTNNRRSSNTTTGKNPVTTNNNSNNNLNNNSDNNLQNSNNNLNHQGSGSNNNLNNEGGNFNVGSYFSHELFDEVKKNSDSIRDMRLVMEGTLSGIDKSRLKEEELLSKIRVLREDLYETSKNSDNIKIQLLEKISSLPDWSQNMLKFELKNDKFSQSLIMIQDNINNINSKVTAKAEKDHIDKKLLDLSSDISKYQLKIEENMKSLEIKTKVLIQKLHNKDEEDHRISPQMFESLVKISKETLTNILVNNLSDHLENNEFMKKQTEFVNFNKEEINRIYESITSIRDSQFDRNKLEEQMKRFSEFEFNSNMDIQWLKKKLNEIISNIEGDHHKDEDKHDFNSSSLKEQVKQLAGLIRVIQIKQGEASEDFDTVKNDLYVKIKKDMNFEGTKVLEIFKKDLARNLKLVEEKLKDKVDQMGLDNLTRFLEQKITAEMLKKLDLNDLKKNNKLIDQKIDLIENKISRVLIDTLIDLQNEETPLLIKQTQGNEKCMSCNQNIVINNTSNFIQNYPNPAKAKDKVKANKSSTENNPGKEINTVSSMYNTNNNNTVLPEITTSNSLLKSQAFSGHNSTSTKAAFSSNKQLGAKKKISHEGVKNKYGITSRDSTAGNFNNASLMTEGDINRQYRELINDEVSKSNLNGKSLMKKADEFISKKIE